MMELHGIGGGSSWQRGDERSSYNPRYGVELWDGCVGDVAHLRALKLLIVYLP